MIRLLVKKLLDDKNYNRTKNITLNQVSEETGISRATLNRIVNVPGFKTNTDAINALCKFFDCTPADLIEYKKDKAEPQEVQQTPEDKNEENS